MKQERIVYKNGKFPNDVRNVVVSDYKDVLSIGNSVMIEGKKWIVIAKEDSKCVVMDMLGNIKRYYYKYIDYIYLTKETSCDVEIIDFMKTLNLKSYNVVDYEQEEKQFRCQDGSLHSYSFLLNKYLKQAKLAV
jgi:hypothetical protein